MRDNSRVVWSEGMFLQPQHFQQHDRHIENWVNGRCGGLRAYGWGFRSLKLDRGLLAMGKLGVLDCQGLFQDGTPFHMPGDDELPLALDIPDGFKGLVYLSLPLRRPGFAEIDSPAHPEPLARYRLGEVETPDHNSGAGGSCPVQIGRLQARLLLERQERDGHACLGVAKVVEVLADKTVVLDDKFIPPSLRCAAAANLASYLRELQGLLRTRGDALAGVTVEAARIGSSGTASFLLLQTINRYEPLLAHWAAAKPPPQESRGRPAVNDGDRQGPQLHPEEFYRSGLQLAGELSTFYKPGKRPISFPAYDHDDLQASFGPLMAELRRLLAEAIDPDAIRISLAEARAGLYITPNRPEYINLLDKASFVLGVKASVSTEALRTGFPPQVKIGPGEKIGQLIQLALPGIEISPLMQLPAALPTRADMCYFGLSKQGEWWQQMSASGGFAIHIGGRFPDLELEFWAIKG